MRILSFFFVVAWAFSFPLEAKQCKFELSTPQPVLQAGKKQTTCVKIGVQGFELDSGEKRAPLNIALVIDRSGSMTGQKIERAKEAAIQAIGTLDSKDIVSIIVFDQNVDVLVPATKLSDRQNIEQKIKSIQPGGSTALYGGTEKGASEVRKFFDRNFVNRIVLLSDGQANVGPQSPDDLGRLGDKLGKEGISVTTFGLGNGYNEDLMSKLAGKSGGNHAFIEAADQLADIFRKEFKTAVSVVAQDVSCKVKLPEGVRPVRTLNIDSNISGREVAFSWSSIYSNHERYVMLEVEVPAEESGQKRELAQATLQYLNMETKNMDTLSSRIEVQFSSSAAEIKEKIAKPVMEEYIELVGNAENKRAMELRDKGDVKGARALFSSNAAFLNENSARLGGSSRLEKSANTNTIQSSEVDSSSWPTMRKQMIKLQYSTDTQQSY